MMGGTRTAGEAVTRLPLSHEAEILLFSREEGGYTHDKWGSRIVWP